MTPISLHHEQQPDGTAWLVADRQCERGRCTETFIAGELPDTCGHLHAESMDEDGVIKWLCGR